MSLLIPDASVAAKWYFEEPHSGAAKRALSIAHELHAPDFIFYEIDSILLKNVRRGAVSLTEAAVFRAAFRSARIETHPSLPLADSAYALAAETRCGMYDCLYLAQAILLHGQLVSADRRSYNILAVSPYAGHILWVEDIP